MAALVIGGETGLRRLDRHSALPLRALPDNCQSGKTFAVHRLMVVDHRHSLVQESKKPRKSEVVDETF
jgi:hypothetical protein